jgi:cyclin-dependent kinase 8/11
MPPYRCKVRVLDKYQIIGFISSGTYGRVYKARSRTPGNKKEFAIKKFKPDKEGEVVQYTGISQSACREMAVSLFLLLLFLFSFLSRTRKIDGR